jgi:large subunit ribosomal protein L29
MKAAEVRALSDADLAQAIEDARQEMFNLRFQQATNRLSDTSRLRQLRREMARLLTVERERSLWAAYEAGLPDRAEG